jgi:UDPglucose--hexose-1-phosphate uridylyltransferase
VVVETPRHIASIVAESDEQIIRVLRAYRDRLRMLRGDRRIAYAMVFKNQGRAAGASQVHAHSQILATSHVPPAITAETAGCREHAQRHGTCAFCALIASEIADGRRLVAATDRFVAFCPYASRFPLELWVVPRSHQPSYESIDDDTLTGLGRLWHRLLAALEAMLDPPAYNYFLHTAPFASDDHTHFHWHWEIAPRTLGIAGFEFGGGMFINPLMPELAAQRWRQSLALLGASPGRMNNAALI